MRQNWYTILLMCSLLAAGGWQIRTDYLERESKEEQQIALEEEQPEEEVQEEQTAETEPGEEMHTEDEQHRLVLDETFEDVLFIGDSRTVGLAEYGGLDEAEVFADAGLSAYTVMTRSLPDAEGTERTLEEVLSQKSYKAVFLMLGINELGYRREAAMQKYRELTDLILEAQPDAFLILEANLHMTEKKSAKDQIFNNQNINEINEAIHAIALEKGLGWLDVNELFDDENGNLNADLSGDGAHIYAKYYKEWTSWILEKIEADKFRIDKQ